MQGNHENSKVKRGCRSQKLNSGHPPICKVADYPAVFSFSKAFISSSQTYIRARLTLQWARIVPWPRARGADLQYVECGQSEEAAQLCVCCWLVYTGSACDTEVIRGLHYQRDSLNYCKCSELTENTEERDSHMLWKHTYTRFFLGILGTEMTDLYRQTIGSQNTALA